MVVQPGLCQTWSETPKTGFLTTRLKCIPATVSIHYDSTPMQYSAIFNDCKNGNFQMKNCDIFIIFAQNIDCGSTLDLKRTHNLYFRAKIRKVYTPVNPSFTI